MRSIGGFRFLLTPNNIDTYILLQLPHVMMSTNFTGLRGNTTSTGLLVRLSMTALILMGDEAIPLDPGDDTV